MQSIRGICRWAYQLVFSFFHLLLLLFADSLVEAIPFLLPICFLWDVSLFLSRTSYFFPCPSVRPFVLQTGRPKEASNVALSSLSIWADSVELPSSKVRASNEAINKSTALTGLSTLFVRDDVSILEFFSCLRVHEVGPISILAGILSSPLSPRAFRWLDCRRLNRVFPRFFV